jgi:Mu transposase-like protein
VHRETSAAPVDRLAVERAHLHVLPGEPHTAARGSERLVNEDQTVRVGSVRYSTPPGYVGTRVWCRSVGEELAIVAMTPRGTARMMPMRIMRILPSAKMDTPAYEIRRSCSTVGPPYCPAHRSNTLASASGRAQ